MLDAFIIQKIQEDRKKKEKEHQEQPALYIEEYIEDRQPKPKEKESTTVVIDL